MLAQNRLVPKWKGLLVLLVLVCSMVTACGAATPESTPLPAGPTPTVTVPIELPVVVSLVGRFSQQQLAILDQQIATFEAENPDIRAEIVEVRGNSRQDRQTIGNQLAEENTDLDIFLLDDAWLAEFAAKGWLLPLDDYVKSSALDMSEFLPGTVQASTIDGELVALPWIADGGVLYYRSDLLEKEGHTPPDTWADLQSLAFDLKATEGLPFGHVWQGAARESLTCNTLEFVWAYGGDVLDEGGKVVFDSPQTRAALQQMSDLVTSGVSPSDIATYRENTALAAFRDGESAFMRNWPYAWDRLNASDSSIRGQIGVASPPASCLLGQTLALSASSMHPDQAFRLMQFLVGYEQQLQMAGETGRPSALETVYHSTELLQVRPFFESLHTILVDVRPRPRTTAYPQVSEAIYTEVNRMLAGEQDVNATVASIQRRIESGIQH
jgi:multiple sugar transport system substrate-binding protein